MWDARSFRRILRHFPFRFHHHLTRLPLLSASTSPSPPIHHAPLASRLHAFLDLPTCGNDQPFGIWCPKPPHASHTCFSLTSPRHHCHHSLRQLLRTTYAARHSHSALSTSISYFFHPAAQPHATDFSSAISVVHHLLREFRPGLSFAQIEISATFTQFRSFHFFGAHSFSDPFNATSLAPHSSQEFQHST